MKKQVLTVMCAAVLAGCAGESKKEEVVVAPESPKMEECNYSYDPATAKLEMVWVSYKYTDKTGVKGSFDEIEISGFGSGSEPSSVLLGSKMKINTASTNSGDAIRDPKIKSVFFGGMEDGLEILAEITECSGNGTEGKLSADITMNKATVETPGTYAMRDGHIELRFKLDVASWSAMPALDALNEECEDLHKGADGKSILWPNVDVFVTAEFTKDCK
jgi:polyisoprenoid-binding protein YceI